MRILDKKKEEKKLGPEICFKYVFSGKTVKHLKVICMHLIRTIKSAAISYLKLKSIPKEGTVIYFLLIDLGGGPLKN